MIVVKDCISNRKNSDPSFKSVQVWEPLLICLGWLNKVYSSGARSLHSLMHYHFSTMRMFFGLRVYLFLFCCLKFCVNEFNSNTTRTVPSVRAFILKSLVRHGNKSALCNAFLAFGMWSYLQTLGSGWPDLNFPRCRSNPARVEQLQLDQRSFSTWPLCVMTPKQFMVEITWHYHEIKGRQTNIYTDV